MIRKRTITRKKRQKPDLRAMQKGLDVAAHIHVGSEVGNACYPSCVCANVCVFVCLVI